MYKYIYIYTYIYKYIYIYAPGGVGSSLIRNRALLGPYSRSMPRVVRGTVGT